jgi:4-deoxy-L-threo-5-hexosulose-uronate ketol-isomerase
MRYLYALDPVRTAQLDTDGLRQNYLIANLFVPGKVELAAWEVERAVVGAAVPTAAPLSLPAPKMLAAEFFCERRELGIINIGGAGTVEVDGQAFEVVHGDALYVSRGSKSVVFRSADPANPALFYLLSYPAHTAFPTRLVRRSEANEVRLGSKAEANERVIRQFIRPGVCESCQLVMGYTELAEGSVWNTWKPHTHGRRSEVYMYFNIQPNECVMHFLGKPEETRHLVVRNQEVALSPSWSIHSGCGTKAYTFVWGMGGENQVFTDMDPVARGDLR